MAVTNEVAAIASPRNPEPPPRFYVTGGTVPTDASSYVTRQADTDLMDRLRAGDFCYVLNSRQIGKSSLMVRTAIQLRSEGVAVAVIDLTAIGQNLSAAQWYEGILCVIGEQLDIEDEIEDFLDGNRSTGPLQRFMNAIRQVVLPLMGKRPVVLFVDEIDAVRSLSFSTDEFFAATRECYNRRTTDPEMERLTFCLLGVATPADLIRDVRTTPFNIGRRVELTDFTVREAMPLARGMSGNGREGVLLLRRVMYWTNGHPYLTQRLCQAIATERSIRTPLQVDRLCRTLFLSRKARETDDNLAFVRNRMLQSEVDLFDLLELYSRIWRRLPLPLRPEEVIRVDDSNPLVAVLLLAGVVRVSGRTDGSLRIRNRIYRNVFDPAWAEMSLPDGALRRQRVAVRRARLQVGSVAACIVALIAWLAVTAYRGTAEARSTTEASNRLLYVADMNLAQQAWSTDNVARVAQLLGDVRDNLNRGFEWDYLTRLCHLEEWSVQVPDALPGGEVTALAFSADGQRLCFGTKNGAIRVSDAKSTARIAGDNRRSVSLIRYSPDGKRVMVDGRIYDVATTALLRPAPANFNAGSMDCSADLSHIVSWMRGQGLVVWDSNSGRQIAQIPVGSDGVNSLALSQTGHWLAVATGSKYAEIFNLDDLRESRRVITANAYITYVGFTGSDSSFITVSADNKSNYSSVEQWDATTGKRLVGFGLEGNLFAVSPDGELLATPTERGTVKIWTVRFGSKILEIRGNTRPVSALCFSPDSRTLATASLDGSIKVWSAKDAGTYTILSKADMGNDAAASAIDKSARWPSASSPDGKTVVVCGLNPRIFEHCTTGPPGGSGQSSQYACSSDAIYLRVSPAIDSPPASVVDLDDLRNISCADFSPDNKQIITGTMSGTVTVWNARTGESMLRLIGHSAKIMSATWSHDGKRIVTSSDDGTVRLWDPQTGRQIYSFDGYSAPFGKPALFSDDGTSLIFARTDPADGPGTPVLSSVNASQSALAAKAETAIRMYNMRHSGLRL